MADYELIGKTLAHSFSKPIHEALGAYEYSLREIPDEEALRAYFETRAFKGCNVTIPYKQAVMPLLDEIDERAAAIGAVNTVVNQNGRLVGYNTDYDGFAYLLSRKNVSLTGKTLLLLGSGATAKTATAVAKDAGAARVLVASRSPKPGQLSYEEAMRRGDADMLVNVSPAGMYPKNGESLVDITRFGGLAAVADVVYNPLKTKLLLDAEAAGIPAASGLAMLVEQAVAAARLFTGKPFGRADSERILREVYAKLANLILIGMPSCGKSKLGRSAARKLGRPFLDLDKALEKKAGKTIPAIFKTEGEEAFRRLESEVLAEETKLPGRVLATGGGVVTRPHNHPLLHQNGVVLFLDRPLAQLHVGGRRPLSKSTEALAAMLAQRRPLYEAAADTTVVNSASFSRTVHKVVDAFYASLTP